MDIFIKKRTVALVILLPLLLVIAWESKGEKEAFTISGLEAVKVDDSGDNGLLHGDTSVSDEELKKLYGDKMPEEIMLMALSRKLPPVLFPHEKHVEMGLAHCGNCHHKDPKDVKGCYTCHLHEPEEEKTPNYQNAHHGLCHPCHKARNKGEEVPPVKCLNCHKKENKEKADKVNNNKP